MTKLLLSTLTIALTLGLLVAAPASAEVVAAVLDGYQETPSISTRGNGIFRGDISADGQSISYLLIYFDLEAPVLFAHIHLGERGVAGGIVMFLCGGGGKPACPALGVPFTGLLTASDVTPVTAQGVAAGEFAEVVRAIRAGAAYANVHTQTFTAGEIRGQIK